MDFGLNNKIAFIGASSQGLGKAVAIELAKEGANVAICGRNEEPLLKMKSEIEKIGKGKVIAVRGDLSVASERQFIVNSVIEYYGKIDILITNTGGPKTGKFEDLSQEDWNETYELLLGSTVSLINSFLPGMKEQKWGRIIAITSQAVKQPVDNLMRRISR